MQTARPSPVKPAPRLHCARQLWGPSPLVPCGSIQGRPRPRLPVSAATRGKHHPGDNGSSSEGSLGSSLASTESLCGSVDYSVPQEDRQADEDVGKPWWGLQGGVQKGREWWRNGWSELWGRLLYSYYNWRQDTWSDLQLFLWINLALFLAGGAIHGAVVQRLDPSAQPPPELQPFGILGKWWMDLYQVMLVVLGQDLPDLTSGVASQVFAVSSAVVGLASFALVLALMEQVVLEVVESNVRRGSQVYEEGHIVVLAWCESARDLGLVKRVLTQICAANRARGKGTVVVLAQSREKLDMESIFGEAIPPAERHGTRFVFRQGSPLDPAALHLVAATKARAVILTGDYSRSPEESDSQGLRAAVLLDERIEEQEKAGGGLGPRVVLQVRNPETLPLLTYACSRRVLPVPTSVTIAKRIARLLRHPVIAVYSHMLTDFSSNAHAAIGRYPRLVGKQFQELHALFPCAIVVGMYKSATGVSQLNPEPSTVVQPGDDLIMLRPGPVGTDACPPLKEAPQVDAGDWRPESYVLKSLDEQPLGIDTHTACEHGRCFVHFPEARGSSSLQTSLQHHGKGLYIVPLQYSNTLLPSTDLLICGWGPDAQMWAILQELDHGTQPLPPAARVTLVNDHAWPNEDFEALCREHGVWRLLVEHVQADPRSRYALSKAIDISKYQAAVVLCDEHWLEGATAVPGRRGVLALSQSDMLRLDSAVLLVQLNLRTLLELIERPDINLISERMTYIGPTRFEDPGRLPLGVMINSASFAAKLMTMAAFEPRYLAPYASLGLGSDMVVQDSSAFAAKDEELSYLQLQILMGFYRLPASPGMPLEVVVNPLGLKTRQQKVVWNRGDFRCKLVTMAPSLEIAAATMDATRGSCSLASNGTMPSLEDAEEAPVPAAHAAHAEYGSMERAGASAAEAPAGGWEAADAGVQGTVPGSVPCNPCTNGAVGAGAGHSRAQRRNQLGGDILE